MVLNETSFWALPKVMQIAVPGKGGGIVLVETPFDAIDDNHCRCEGILNPTSHDKTKKSILWFHLISQHKPQFLSDY